MTRRISRGSPVVPAPHEQERLVRLLNTDPELQAAIETLVGKKLHELTFGEQVLALMDFTENGRTLAAVNIAARAKAESLTLAAARNGDGYLAEQLHTAQTEVERLQAENDALRARTAAKPRRSAS